MQHAPKHETKKATEKTSTKKTAAPKTATPKAGGQKTAAQKKEEREANRKTQQLEAAPTVDNNEKLPELPENQNPSGEQSVSSDRAEARRLPPNSGGGQSLDRNTMSDQAGAVRGRNTLDQ